MHVNVQSLGNKIDLINLTLNSLPKKPLMLCFTEHWLCEDQLNCVTIDGYCLANAFCRKIKEHGGSAIFVSNNNISNVKILSKITTLSTKKVLECSAVKINGYCILNVYRPPTANFHNFIKILSDIFAIATNLSRNIILCGDLNVNALGQTLEKKILFDVFDSFNLRSLIDCPTRECIFQNKHVSTAIDYVVTNNNSVSAMVFDPGYSDHYGQIINFQSDALHIPEPVLITFRSFNKNAITKFKNNFILFTNSYLDHTDVDAMFTTFFSSFIECFNVAFPLRHKTFTPKSNKKIKFSENLIRMKTELENLNWLRKRTQDPNIHLNYKKCKKNIQSCIRSEKIEKNNKFINLAQNKTKAGWDVINKHSSRLKKTNIITEINTMDKIITDQKDIADEFGRYLSSVVKNKLSQHFGSQLSNECTYGPFNPETMFFVPTTPFEIEKTISAIPTRKSPGPDKIPVTLLKECSGELSVILSNLINSSVEQGTFPQLLKQAEIVPVFKKGDRKGLENYRPIALLSIFSKIYEKVIYERTTNFLNVHNIFSSSQHGFRKGLSTESASVDLTQHVFNCMDKNEHVVVLLFDFTRAFDTVDPKFVAAKLDRLGVRGSVNKLFQSFLKDRSFYVKIGNKHSEDFLMDMGTPQGSVLGPLIFTIFINDLSFFVKSAKLFLYCDDTTAVVSDPDLENLKCKTLACLNEISGWCKANNLMLNNLKTNVVEIYNKYKNPNHLVIDFEGHTLASSSFSNFLGVTIDNNLDWAEHIEGVCKRLNKSAFMIKQLGNSLGVRELKNVYYSAVHSVISYNIILWGGARDVERVFVIQKRIIRLIFSIPYRQSCRELFKSQRILTVTSIFILKVLTFTYRNRTNLESLGDNHSYNTRGRNNLLLAKHCHEFYKKSPFYVGSYLFNLLPTKLKLCSTIRTFKTQLKELLLSDAFYTLREFEAFMKLNK